MVGSILLDRKTAFARFKIDDLGSFTTAIEIRALSIADMDIAAWKEALRLRVKLLFRTLRQGQRVVFDLEDQDGRATATRLRFGSDGY